MSTLQLSTTGAMIERFEPRERLARAVFQATLAILGTAIVTASAYVRIPLPGTDVPVTGQTFAVLLIGALYGRVLGATTLGLYLTQGVMGLPVFAGGMAGAAYLVGPTGGYLVGFIAAAWLVGSLAQRGWDRSIVGTVVAMSLGTLLIFLFGAGWLAFQRGMALALMQGVVPFLPGAIVKIALAAACLPLGWRLLKWLER